MGIIDEIKEDPRILILLLIVLMPLVGTAVILCFLFREVGDLFIYPSSRNATEENILEGIAWLMANIAIIILIFG